MTEQQINPITLESNALESNALEKVKNNIACIEETKYFTFIYGLSILIIVILLIIVLQSVNPILLFIILLIIMIYIMFSESERIPVYLIPTIGILIYLVDLLIKIQSTGITSNDWAFWKFPFYSIISYYVLLAGIYLVI